MGNNGKFKSVLVIVIVHGPAHYSACHFVGRDHGLGVKIGFCRVI